MGFACIENFGCDECCHSPRALIIATCNTYPVYHLSLCMSCSINIKQEFQTMINTFLYKRCPLRAIFSGLGIVREKTYDGITPFCQWIRTEIANHSEG